MDFYLLETAGKAAATASQGSLQSHDLLAQIVQDPQGERPSWPTAVPSATVSIFHSKINSLPEAVLDFIFVICFKAC